MAAFLDVCRFNPSAGGTTDWTYSSAATGYQSPANAGVANGRLYKYRAESADLSQWEIGEGAYNTSTGVLARTTVLFNSLGTTAKISFAAAPQVAIVALKEDLISIEEANAFTAAQKLQARGNIDAAKSPSFMTTTVLTSGSGTYSVPTGAKALHVRMVGGGGGGCGSGSGAGSGANGNATTLGSSFLTANGGTGATSSAGAAGGTASGGFLNLTGQNGGSTTNYSAGNGAPGGRGGGSAFFHGGGAQVIGAGGAGVANTGGGGAGGAIGSGLVPGGGGGGGGSLESWITSPSASYSYVVGAGGAGGTVGSSGNAGGTGGSGVIIVEEFY